MGPRVLTDVPPPADERLAYGDHPSQFIDFRRPAAPLEAGSPLIIMLHGGFWRARYDLLHAGHLCAALTTEGFVTANIEYRRAGEPGGGWPGTFQDVKQAIAFAREKSGNPPRTIVIGHSAGGHLALWVASEIQDLTAVIALAPVATLHQTLSNHAAEELMGGPPSAFPDRYGYADPARPTVVPRTIIHGTDDDIVPITLSHNYAAPAKLIEIPTAGHFALIDPQTEAYAALLTELQQSEPRP